MENTRVRSITKRDGRVVLYDESKIANAILKALAAAGREDAARRSNLKRDNANVDGNTSMGSMLQLGSAAAKSYNTAYLLTPEQARAYEEGWIHIHDFDFYALTTTCCQIDIDRLFTNGFNTGHGYLREPQDIQSYAALACIAIQSNQNDQHGGQGIPNFDYALAKGVKKTYRRLLIENLRKALSILAPDAGMDKQAVTEIVDAAEAKAGGPSLGRNEAYVRALGEGLQARIGGAAAEQALQFTLGESEQEIGRRTYQAMESVVHNLNSMPSRAGAQTPFSSINYGTDTSDEGRLVIRNILLATEAGLGHGETPIFPIQIFKLKAGVNYNPGDPNYDLFKMAIKTSAMRLFPNFSFLDAPFNLQYYKPGDYNSEVAYMGCRTRVLGNVYDPDRQVTCGRGNLSFTSINLPRLGIEAKGDLDRFFQLLDDQIDLVFRQLLHRFDIQCSKKVRNYPFLMGNGIWLDSEKLDWDESVAEVLKHGTLTVGFIGLAETLVALTGKHHGESEESQKLGLRIVEHMRKRCDDEAAKTHLNFTLIATPAEGLSGRFVALDRKKYGVIKGVTDREYYTNSFHVPVYFPIKAFRKIELEAPYHSFTNAGHITYVELDGDTCKNLEAFETIIRFMHDKGVGYGSINHPLDRDPVCGYVGVINGQCPRCGRKEGEAVSQETLKMLRRKYPHMPNCCR